MAPSLIASYFLEQNTTTNTALTTPSFTPSNGEVVIVKLGTWDTNVSMGTPTGGSQTYTSQIIVAPGGFKEWCGIYTATISGSPGSMTISSTPSASARYSMTVERWSSATLDATPATNSGGTTVGVSSAAASSLTTTAANSVISWVCTDVNSTDPATRAYLGSATEDGLRDGHVGSNGVEYYAYQAVASAGSTSFGLSAPTTMSWNIAGIEVKDAGGASLDPTTSSALPRLIAGIEPATHADRRSYPQQRDRRDNGVATTANPLPSPLSRRPDPTWSPRLAWQPQQCRLQQDQSTAASATIPGGNDDIEHPRFAALTHWRPSWMARQRTGPAVDLTTALLEVPGGTDSNEPEMLGGALLRTPWTPQQRTALADQSTAATVNLDVTLAGGTLRTAAVWRRDQAMPVQRVTIGDLTYLGFDQDPTVLASLVQRVAQTWAVDRREVPQQRTYYAEQSALPVNADPTLLGWLVGQVQRTWPTDRRVAGQQRPYLGVDLTTALLENELLGSVDDLARHRSWIRPYVAGQQRLIQVDESVQPAVADPTLLGALVAMVARAWPSDRREMPQQRAYISDPSFYPTVAPTDPLLLAWGADGPLWHLYNDSALRDRRQAGQQRTYLGADLATALLENELLGGADDRGRHLAWFVDRREVPQQRAYPNVFVDDALLGSADDLARHRAWYTDRRLVPQQRTALVDQSVQPQPFDVTLRPWQLTAYGPLSRPTPWLRMQPPIMAPVTQPVVALRAGRIVLGVRVGPGVDSGITAGAFLTTGMRTAPYADPISDQGS